ncbi:apolipoprotein D-like isoform X1 [Diorhabda carinulata]|uniref:apolipoprotein D-like isoform X1 n=1 Tax=Diorhabda carinulata TaxID=1163345 RepID=UPI0025A2FF1B|nr:apolipoprotein D-like isoform X1 [Diorhabda carinulata]
MFTVIICILVVSKITTAQIPSVGSCPNVETVQNFDVARYLGKWFEMERYFAIFELGGKCVTAEYSLHDNGTVHVRNQQLQFYTEAQTTIDGTARLASNTGEAKLLVTFPSLPVTFDAPYWVVETDYDSYSVVWSCVDLRILNFRKYEILFLQMNFYYPYFSYTNLRLSRLLTYFGKKLVCINILFPPNDYYYYSMKYYYKQIKLYL